jgi:parallel beta-helix repeat protein
MEYKTLKRYSLHLVCLVISILVSPLFNGYCWSADYYVNPDPSQGSDNYDGTGPTFESGKKGPKKTIGSLVRIVKPGDTVYLRGGTYHTDQGWFTNANIGSSGAKDQPITITRYKNEVPRFTGAGLFGVVFCISKDWIIVDGLDFEGCLGTSYVILLEGSHNIIRNCTVRKVRNFIRLDNGSSNFITHNTASNIGDNGKGLGEGEFIYVRGGEYNEISDNRIDGTGHAAITLLDYPNYVKLSKFNKIRGNIIDQKNGGGGIYVARGCSYNLIEGNIIKNVGQLEGITQNKAGILIEAPNNSVRKNVILNYGVEGNEAHRGIMLASASPFDNKNCINNYIYNNIIYGGFGLPVYFRQGIGDRDKGYVVKNNIFANNIIYNAPTEKIHSGNFVGMYTPPGLYSIYLGIYSGGSWDNLANENVFMNNLLFNKLGESLIGYYYGSGGWGFPIANAQKKFPDVFSGNIYGIDPQIEDKSLLTWKPKKENPVVDAGRIIDDTNGKVGGWENLKFCGRAPDIGFYEVCD